MPPEPNARVRCTCWGAAFVPFRRVPGLLSRARQSALPIPCVHTRRPELCEHQAQVAFQGYNPDLSMRRLTSIALLLVVNALAAAPLLSLSASPTVPVCCRKGCDGRCPCCKRRNAHARAENQSGLPAVSSSCPCPLRLTSAAHSSVFQTVSPDWLASFTVALRAGVARVTHFVHGADRYSQPKRGPPAFLS